MKTLKSLISAGLIAGSLGIFGNESYGQNKETNFQKNLSWEKVKYVHFDSIPWEKIPDSASVNIEFDYNIYPFFSSFGQSAQMDSAIFSEAEKLGYSKENIQKLSPKEAVDLAISIDTSRFTYTRRENRTTDKLDELFIQGKGVCVEYANSFPYILNLLSKQNNSLSNIHSTYRLSTDHIWNVLGVFADSALYLSEIDITFLDNPKSKILNHYTKSDIDQTDVKINALHKFNQIKTEIQGLSQMIKKTNNEYVKQELNKTETLFYKIRNLKNQAYGAEENEDKFYDQVKIQLFNNWNLWKEITKGKQVRRLIDSVDYWRKVHFEKFNEFVAAYKELDPSFIEEESIIDSFFTKIKDDEFENLIKNNQEKVLTKYENRNKSYLNSLEWALILEGFDEEKTKLFLNAVSSNPADYSTDYLNKNKK